MKDKIVIGYCRISTNRQNLERQERNILARYPDALIYKEVYTGTKITGRKVWNTVYNLVRKEADKKDITIVFDSVEYSGAAEPPFRCGVSHLSGMS